MIKLPDDFIENVILGLFVSSFLLFIGFSLYYFFKFLGLWSFISIPAIFVFYFIGRWITYPSGNKRRLR